MELSDYNLTFAHIKGSNNILGDAISKVKTLDIYRDPLENPKLAATRDTEECIAEVVTNNIQTVSVDRLWTEQRKDINCRNLAAHLYHKNKDSFNSLMISAEGILQKQQCIHRLKHDVIIVPHFYHTSDPPWVAQFKRSSRNHPYIWINKILLVA